MKKYLWVVVILIVGISSIFYLRSRSLENKNNSVFRESWEEKCIGMVEQQIEKRGVKDPLVLKAMREVPRHEFVPENLQNQAYDDTPLPIGYGQTISQPYIVALMTENLQIVPGCKVLEVGTGSGYQAAILARMGCQVYTIEIIKDLAEKAEEKLKELSYDNVIVKQGDGYLGWEEETPFDRIIVTCAVDHLPPPLLSQLKEGGKMVIPVGPPWSIQSLWVVEKTRDGITTRDLGAVRFVPLTRESQGE
ncbi:MAG: protein-L-isoaspartate(D-aspartate) O-methyltransferase [Atribacterota bacterium]|jgi:protein-L-isoaspartate(D-aspartate) O-methyltransferase|nr:protein-L-isoaspartate(D-aspartate) O-methyltransferase [Atribacterota bacterium]